MQKVGGGVDFFYAKPFGEALDILSPLCINFDQVTKHFHVQENRQMDCRTNQSKILT